MSITRRRFLEHAVVGTAVTTAACHKRPEGEAGRHPDADPQAQADANTVEISTTVNGGSQTLRVGADESALSLVRDRLGLTGCKLGCGHGACGACTMQLDGAPVAACLLPAMHLHNRTLTTVEGLRVGDEGPLHPVQRAFMAADAMQCGYCTAGFVVEAAAFHDRWRAQHGTRSPSREQVADALAGHLCRCGAYPGIYRAVIAACEGKHDDEPTPVASLGPRVDGLAKVTGAARYTVDQQPEGMLHGKFLRSPHAHARVVAIDWRDALEHPGVLGVVPYLEPGHKVRFAGQEILCLAAVDEATALAALRRIRVEYQLLTPVVGRDAAVAADAPAVYDRARSRKHAPNESEGPLLPDTWRGNLRGPFSLLSHHGGQARRRINAAVAGDSNEAYFAGVFETQTQIHTNLEPRAAVAVWTGDDLLVFASTQGVRHLAEDIAERWRLKPEQVEVRAEYTGGGFGAKTQVTLEIAAAIDLGKLCGRPVRVVNDRREELTVGGRRPGVRTEVALASGLEQDDGPPALVVDARADAGVAVGSATSLLIRLHLPQADLALADYDVITNAPPGCPFRGPGGPPAFFAVEQAIDALAKARAVDPIGLRRRWNQNPNRALVYDWAEQVPLWRDRPPPGSDTGRFRRGVGLATATWFYFAEPAARIRLDADAGGIVLSSATQDMGNGSRTVIADVVAGVLGVSPHEVDVRLGSSKGVHGPMSAGSRTATSMGPAAHEAAMALREELLERAITQLKIPDLRPGFGGVVDGQGQPVASWAELLELGPAISITGRRRRDVGGFVISAGGVAIGRYLSASAQVSEVEVDVRLGRVRVLRTVVGMSVGEIYSPVLARSQVEGGVVQGIGLALYEEQILDRRHGALLTGGLEDYRLCGLGDVGEIDVHFIPGGYEKVRGHGVGLAELCTMTPAATVANAVFAATGWRPERLPLRPDRVLAGLASASSTTTEAAP